MNGTYCTPARRVAEQRIAGSPDPEFWGDPRIAFIDGAAWAEPRVPEAAAVVEAERRHLAGRTGTWWATPADAFVEGSAWARVAYVPDAATGH